MRNAAVANLQTQIEAATAAGSVRLFSVRHEFPTEWARFKKAERSNLGVALTLNLREQHYPFWSQGRLRALPRVEFFAPEKLTVQDQSEPAGTVKAASLEADATFGNLMRANVPEMRLKQPNDQFEQKPTGELKLLLDNRTVADVWLAITWSSGG